MARQIKSSMQKKLESRHGFPCCSFCKYAELRVKETLVAGKCPMFFFKCNLRLQGLDKRRRGWGLVIEKNHGNSPAAGIFRTSHRSDILPFLIVGTLVSVGPQCNILICPYFPVYMRGVHK